jgi:hypothetical protein
MRPSIQPRRAGALLALALAAGGAGATDIATAPVPSDLPDRTVQVAQRRLHLPPGHWVLVAREDVVTEGGRSGKRRAAPEGTGLQAWIAREDAGRLAALVWLSLPLQDFPGVHHRGDTGCPDEDGIERADLSPNPKRPDCLRVYGHRDMRRTLANRSAALVAWMGRAQVATDDAMVRFIYRERSDGAYGGISLYLPTPNFESDEVASAWARRLRDACQPLFEGRVSDAELPPMPAPGEDAAASAPARD